MSAGVLDAKSTPDLEFRQDPISGLHGEAVHEGLCDRFSDRSRPVVGNSPELVAQGLDLGEGWEWRGCVCRCLGELCLAGSCA
ncbi:hypothetical protein SAMN02745225_02127 [Ferrithrix thermotolerans DSM 19514]|uniref:Uncharacterized protein n=1 Tax=Ferrithrix thermotolerans DSM 19514 TaxID=1121881 RepID=A0A1M4XSX8_9ACTN|nr:hypothetical protein SAMN02745225_02127 [Ferrithrix thermotolerans DSM 19514]